MVFDDLQLTPWFVCRSWTLILGGVILVFGLLPSFRSVRLLNIIALVGTNYSCLYFFIYAVHHGRVHGAFTRCTFSPILPVLPCAEAYPSLL